MKPNPCRCGFESTSFRAMKAHKKEKHSEDFVQSFLVPPEDGKPGGMVHIHSASDGTRLTEKETQAILSEAKRSVQNAE